MKRRNLDFITVLYGLAALFVLFGHSHPLHIPYPEWLGGITRFVYVFHMPLFFFISGMLIAYTAEGRDIGKWWKAKAYRLLVPYIALTLLAWIPKYMLGAYMNDCMEISFGNIIRILLIPREGIWGHFWFIPVYLLLMLICAALYPYMAKKSLIFKGGTLSILSFKPLSFSYRLVWSERHIG